MKLFKALRSDTPDKILMEEAIPNISSLAGSHEMSENLGFAVRNGNNGTINAHININARLFGGEFRLSEEEAYNLILSWNEKIDFNNFNDEELGMKFLTEVISKIVD